MSYGLYCVINCTKQITFESAQRIIKELNKKGFVLDKSTSGDYEIGKGHHGDKLIQMQSTEYFMEHHKIDITLSFNYTINCVSLRVFPYSHVISERDPELKQRVEELVLTIKQLASEMFEIKSIEESWD